MKNALPHNGQHLYQVGEFQLNTADGVLLRDGAPVSITPKMFDVLWLLVQNQGRIVAKDELLRAVWSDSFVEEANITVTIGQLRKVLGDDAHTPSYIQTVARRGYRFVAPVEEIRERTEPESDALPRVNGNGGAVAQRSAAQNGGNGKLVADHSGALDERITSRYGIKKKRFRWAPVVIVVGILAVSVGSFYVWQNRTRTIASRLTNLRAERLTDTGNAGGAAISPDGKLIAYTSTEGNQTIIWLQQLVSGKILQILPAPGEMISGVSFSNDGQYIDYFTSTGGAFSSVSRISILGGTPTKLLSQVHGSYTFSPDGTQLAFTRFEDHVASVFVANADGSNERQLITAPKGESIISVNWSPDGSSIAYSIGKFRSRGTDFGIAEYQLASGTQLPLTDFRWNDIEALRWLPDKSGLLLSGRDTVDAANQIWLVTLPKGEVRQISFDSSSLKLRGATSDFSKILAVQQTLASKIWTGEASDLDSVQSVASSSFDVAIARDGSIVFPAADTLTTDIWISTHDGTGRRQLTNNQAVERSPAVSPDGKLIVYSSSFQGKQTIWRMDIDGGNPTMLTTMEGSWPTFTPDGRFVIFNAIDRASVLKVPVEGGEPTVVFNGRAMRPVVAPDGYSFAHFGLSGSERMLYIRKLDGGELIKEIAIPGRPVTQLRPKWTADGKALFINVTEDSKVGNIYRQPVDGSPPEKMTNFTSDIIFDFDLSSDDNRIVLVRGSWNYNTVLFTGLD